MNPILIENCNSLSYSNKIIYLDRDGVLIEPVIRGENVSSARCVEEIKIYNDAISFCKKVKDIGYSLIVISNQPDLSRKIINLNFIEETNILISNVIDIDYFIYCPHQKEEKCSCRKPKPGMINFFRKKYAHKIDKEIMVGDRMVDYECAKEANINFILRRQPYSFNGRGKILLNYDLIFSDDINNLEL